MTASFYAVRLHLTRRGVLETALVLEMAKARHPMLHAKLIARGYGL